MADVPGRLQTGMEFKDSMPMFNAILDSLDAENRTKIVRNGTVGTVLFGYQKGGFNGKDYGLKVAKDGYEVTTATDDQLAFSSGFDSLKVVGTGTTTFTKPANQTSFTQFVPHSLGYAPIALAFNVSTAFDGTQYSSPWVGVGINATTGTVDTSNEILSTSSNVQFTQRTPSNGPSYPFNIINVVKYYLLQETAL